jgi:hypothetical protein
MPATMEREARAVSDDAFEGQLAEAERVVAWRDALDAEKDRRSVQRRGEPR